MRFPGIPRPGREARYLGGQVVGALAVLAGIAHWSVASALIVGGIALCAWIEVQP